MAINIFGIVGEDVRASEVLTQIQAEEGDTIEVTIMSPGGSVVEGLAIYDALRSSGKEIKTLAMGQAASIASIIFMAGDVREVADNAEIMIHNAMVCAGGNKHELSGIIDVLEDIDQKLINIYTDRSGMSAEDVAELLDQETFMSADEAVNKGFATGKANALALVAIHNKQKEPNMAVEAKEEEKSLLSKLTAFLRREIKAEEELPEKEDDDAEEAKAEGDEEKPDLEEENKALKAELSELKAKAESDDEEREEAKAKEDEDEEVKAQEDEEEKEDEEAKALSLFVAVTDDKITMGEAKKLLKKSASFVAETLKDKAVNATGLGKVKTPTKDSSHYGTWMAMRDSSPKEAQAYYKKHSDAIAKEKK